VFGGSAVSREYESQKNNNNNDQVSSLPL
jgi:hypothetical protein